MVKYGKVLQTACKTGSRRGPWVHRGICRVQEWFNPIPWRLVDRTPKQCNGHLEGKLRYRIIWMENIEHPATGLIETHTAHRKLHQRSSILCPHSLLAIEHQALENTSAKSSKSPKSPSVVTGRLIVLGSHLDARCAFWERRMLRNLRTSQDHVKPGESHQHRSVWVWDIPRGEPTAKRHRGTGCS